jgi:tetratricopeptide (TPR) repeat protein
MVQKQKAAESAPFPIPKELPRLGGLDKHSGDGEGTGRPKGPQRTWLWTLVSAAIVVLLGGYVVIMAVMGVYDGLKDRALENQQIAQEHYALGLEYLQAEDYERAIGEFELALRHDSSLSDARDYLNKAKEKTKAQVAPTSETRLDAVKALYREAVTHYESGALEAAVTALEDLHGLDPEYQSENVATMLAKAHYQLGLNAVAGDRLDEATSHFDTVLTLEPDDKEAQDQLDLINLYSAALNFWERDWAATIQALKGLYALAPDYKDVEIRLHDAYVFRARSLAGQGSWCEASTQYANAVEILPLEETVDARDEARIRCQATAYTPSPTPTAQATDTPSSEPTAVAVGTPEPTTPAQSAGSGRIIFTSYDRTRQRHDIYVVDLAQGNARLVRANASQPALSPGGGLLAFRNLDPDHLGLSILDLRSDAMSQMTAHPEDSTPSWSADGKQIIFASSKHGDRKWRLYAISPSEVRGEGEEWVFGRMPAWSADGSRIAYQGCDAHGDNCAIWVMQPGGFNPAQLTTQPSDTAPAWSPDGSQVAFVSARADNLEIYVVDIATGQETRLTNDAASDVAPAWSPDGKQLAFLSNRGGAWAIYILEIRSGRVEKLIAAGDPYPDSLGERLSWGR